MGLSHHDHAKLQQRLNPPNPTSTPTRPGNVIESTTIGNELTLRGIPVVGAVSGAIIGTRPGDSAQALEQAGRDIVKATLTRNRYRPGDKT